MTTCTIFWAKFSAVFYPKKYNNTNSFIKSALCNNNGEFNVPALVTDTSWKISFVEVHETGNLHFIVDLNSVFHQNDAVITSCKSKAPHRVWRRYFVSSRYKLKHLINFLSDSFP